MHNKNMNNLNRGFSLVEIVVVVGIFGIITVAISTFQVGIFKNNKIAQDSLSSAQDARSILGMMVRELRSASPGNDGSFTIAQAATNTIVFYSDTDGDGLKEKIRYFLATTTLKKGSIKPTGSPLSYSIANEKQSFLAYNIRNSTSTPLFEYFDTNYTGTSSPLTQPVSTTLVRLVKINLVIDLDPNRAPMIRSFTSQVNLRNLKDNL
jgi:prepilin-type N-terminal cleavage/methylation domain-containing protein